MSYYSPLKTLALAAFAGILTVALTAPADAQQRVRWKMHSAWGSTVPHLGTSAVRFSKNIERMSGGKFEMKFFEPGALVPASCHLRAQAYSRGDGRRSVTVGGTPAAECSFKH